MNLLSLIIAALLGLALMAFALLLGAAIVFNLNIGRRYRNRLGRDLEKLRLGRMLAALRIDIQEYLHDERIADIHTQMNRCGDCAQTRTCDERLAAGDVDSASLDYCDNRQDLTARLDRERDKAAIES